jgi:hypothetical protein
VNVKQNTIKAIDLSITPNPSEGMFDINIASTDTHVLCVTDMSGKTVLTGKCNTHTAIDLSDKANGVFILQVRDSNNEVIATRKLIKK